ncbi:MAG: peptidase C39 family protein [Bacteroidota bacterium]
MHPTFRYAGLVLTLLITLSSVAGSAYAKGTVYQTGFDEWLASEGDFASWEKGGTGLNAEGELVLDPASAVPATDPYASGAYYGGNFYNGGSYWVGEATSPVMPAAFDLDELIASWNAVTPAGTWVEMLVRAELSGRWTKWYNLGIWASGSDPIQRHSVRLQGDADGYVAVDTLVVTAKKVVVDAYQLKVRLFSDDGLALPSVRYVSAAYSTTPAKKSAPSAGNPANWNTLIAVPECSQMVYSDGGNVWCSPTSTSMVVSYWQHYTGPCESAVRAAVAGTYDWIYDGNGNWPFNTAYAAAQGLQGSVRRFTSMTEIETWVAQGVPVVISFAWGKGELTGAAIPSSSGHLAVVVGFDVQGNPIVNDPAAASDEDVQRTYLRSELEPLWLKNSGGTVYIIKP